MNLNDIYPLSNWQFVVNFLSDPLLLIYLVNFRAALRTTAKDETAERTTRTFLPLESLLNLFFFGRLRSPRYLKAYQEVL